MPKPPVPKPPAFKLSKILYRHLLKVYPAPFRRRFGRDLEDAFDDSCKARWRSRGWTGLAQLWARSLWDVAAQGIGERLDDRTGEPASLAGFLKGRTMNAFRCEWTQALRSLLRSPGFTVATVLILALAIGANTALYSFLSPFLFRPLSFPQPEQLVHLYETDLSRRGELGWDLERQSGPTYLDWQRRLKSFQDLGAYRYSSVNLADRSDSPEQFDIAWVTPNLFRLLGAQAARGRLLTPEEDRIGDRRAVLGHSLWQTRYGGDPDIVGRQIDLNGMRYLVVGVTPSDFHFPFATVRLWAPMTDNLEQDPRERSSLLVVGRLAEGASRQSAGAELKSVHSALAEAHPEAYRQRGVRVAPLKEALIFFYDLFEILGMVLLLGLGAVLLVVCGNVANLFMARSLQARREMAVRQALGASRGRMMLQTLLQSSIVAAAAAGLGLTLAHWCILSVGGIIPQQVFRVGEVRLDGWTAAVALLSAAVAALVFGLMPAWRAGRHLPQALGEGARGTASKRSRRMTRLLVAGQTACAMFLSGSALLALSTLEDFRRLDLGFQTGGLTTIAVNLPQVNYSSSQSIQSFQQRLLERFEAVPSIEGTALSDMLPLNFEEHDVSYRLPSQPPDVKPNALESWVSPDYFSTMDIPLLQGRTFQSSEETGAEAVIVSQALARRHWPQGDALGQSILLNPGPRERQATVVGVVADAMGGIVFMERRDRIYQLWERSPQRRFFALVRTAGDQTMPAGEIRSLIAELDASVGVTVQKMDDLAGQAARPLKVAAVMLSAFAGFALLLAALGMHGLVSYAASLMEKEIAIRMALGAERRRVLRLIVRQGLRGVLLGMGFGLFLCVGLVVLAALADPSQQPPFAVPFLVAGLTCLAAFSAVLGPARRALLTDPIRALRTD